MGQKVQQWAFLAPGTKSLQMLARCVTRSNLSRAAPTSITPGAGACLPISFIFFSHYGGSLS